MLPPRDYDSVFSPWYYAKKSEHDYITPENITAAWRALWEMVSPMSLELRNDLLETWGSRLYEQVLLAIEADALEDASCCAFVALKYMREEPEKED